MKVNLNNAEFIRSATKEADFPRDRLPQTVFAVPMWASPR